MKPLHVGLSFDASWVGRPGETGLMRGIDVVVFPELVDGGYAALRRGEGVHSPGDTYLEGFRRLTEKTRSACVAGSVCLRGRSGLRTNTTLAYQGGKEIHRYDKVHLFRPTGDTRYFSPGHGAGTFSFSARGRRAKAGVVICYDLRFPELIRVLAREGVEILFVPARWPRVRDSAWRTLLRARAIENQIFVVGCDARGSEGGHSYIVDPFGGEVFSTRGLRAAMMHRCTLDLDRIREARRLHDNLGDARLVGSIRFPGPLRSSPAEDGGPSSRR